MLKPPVVCRMILLSRREQETTTDGDVHKAVWQPACIRLRIIGRRANMHHARNANELLEVLGDELPLIILVYAEQAADSAIVATAVSQSYVHFASKAVELAYERLTVPNMRKVCTIPGTVLEADSGAIQ